MAMIILPLVVSSGGQYHHQEITVNILLAHLPAVIMMNIA
jgi:hypothetical protein